ncbi:MAG: InlB B-repeat-containing protein [Roseburia sp.]|nr:InlB B-repeat-containing protein [Roseburia sp.]
MKKMKMYRYKKSQNSRGRKAGRNPAALFLLFLCLSLGLAFFSVPAFGAQMREDAGETGADREPLNILYGSLEPFQELELTLAEIAAAEAESERPSSIPRKTPLTRAADEWEKYESTYYYDHEKFTEAQKVFWNQLDEQCKTFLTGTADLKFSSDGTCRLDVLTYADLTYEQARQVYQMFRYSKPQYYFLTNSFYKNEAESKFQLSVFPEFAKGADRAEANEKIKCQIEKMLSEINEETTPLMKEKVAHDLICEKVGYDLYFDTMAKNKFNQTIYSVLCTDTTVCAGYSQTMMLFMNACGIDCAVMISDSHAWNLVNLEGTWHYTDLTWDDQQDNWIYTYFNRSREAIHSMDAVSHREEESWVPYLPKTVDAPVKRTAKPSIELQNGEIIMTSYGSDIYYTVDEQTPFRRKRAAKYTAPFAAFPGMQIVAVAYQDGYFESSQLKAGVCQVDFVLDGTSYGTSCLILEGARVTEPVMTPPVGYTFSGWCTNPECTNFYSFYSPVKSSVTLYGKYQKIPAPQEVKPEKICQVLFDSCGGSALAAQSIKEGSQAVQKTPVKKGYTFVGWYTSKDYSSPYDFSTGVTRDMVLYAKWKANTYKVTYQANGGYIGKKSVTSKKVTVTYDKKYGKQPKPKRKGYAFLGWYTKKSKGSRIEDSQLVKITGQKTYYAQWSKVKPKKAEISSVKSKAAGKVTVKIKKAAGASGYEIRYSLKSSMRSAKKVKVSGTEKTISGLKKGKKYYVQVRMYQKESVSGKISYGAWSGKRSVAVKKK